MNWKKISFILITFLTFLGTGFLLSNVQSREADQLLDAHGMSNNTRYFYTDNHQKVKDFLKYLQNNYSKTRIQIHLDNKNARRQVLVWSNHQPQSLPTQQGRYFSKEDFKGHISFAVLGPDVKKDLVEYQGNQYILFNKRYYAVIGEFKNYHQKEQNKYYLTTGIHQPTAEAKLNQFRIVVDSSKRSTIKKIANEYNGSLKTPDFVKNHQIYRFSVIREICLIILLWLVASSANCLIALMQWKQVKITHLSGKLLINWLINRGLRLILIESLLTFVAYLLLRWQAFFNKVDHLILLLFLNWLVAIASYLLVWAYLHLKEKKDAQASK